MGSFQDKVFAVTGAGGGIGSATARLLASRGAKLSLTDIDAKALHQTTEDIRVENKSDVITSFIDVTGSDRVDWWIASTVTYFGKLSGGVNLGGTVGKEFGKKSAHEISDNDFELVMRVNVKGVMACQRAQLRHVEDGGCIVNAASVAGKIGIPNAISYGASKHAVIGSTRVAAAENGHRAVRVNAIAP